MCEYGEDSSISPSATRDPATLYVHRIWRGHQVSVNTRVCTDLLNAPFPGWSCMVDTLLSEQLTKKHNTQWEVLTCILILSFLLFVSYLFVLLLLLLLLKTSYLCSIQFKKGRNPWLHYQLLPNTQHETTPGGSGWQASWKLSSLKPTQIIFWTKSINDLWM